MDSKDNIIHLCSTATSIVGAQQLCQTGGMILAPQRHLFDIPADVAWFNTAYMSAQLKAGTAAGAQGVARKAQPWLIAPADFFTLTEQARAGFAGLIGATANDVAIVPSASYGLEIAARALPVGPGQRILLLDGEFPSNVYPWRRVAAAAGASVETVAAPSDGDWTRAILDRLCGQHAVLAVPNCHWADGGVVDLVRVGAACRSVGTALALDLTQSAGALPISVADVQPDFLVAATYKWLLGPYSLGFLYVSPRWHDAAPLEEGWASREGAEDFAGLTRYRDGYQPGARRFDMGERSNFALLPIALEALAQIAAWTPQGIADTLAALNRQIVEAVAPLGLSAAAEAVRSPHLVGLGLPPHAPADLVARLAARNVFVSQRGERLRISPHLHVNAADIDRLLGGLGAELG
jgi:selenocysteine lyase/cysteine desulfurase